MCFFYQNSIDVTRRAIVISVQNVVTFFTLNCLTDHFFENVVIPIQLSVKQFTTEKVGLSFEIRKFVYPQDNPILKHLKKWKALLILKLKKKTDFNNCIIEKNKKVRIKSITR